jgi:uncharacterized protein DUF262
MRTTATNRKLRLLVTGIRDKTLIPNPTFQRRLVWTNKDKLSFLDTVLNGYPFPEIYIASGEVDEQTGEGTEMLVDGQQRITTLYQYFTNSEELKLGKEIKPYAELSQSQKLSFLEYEVVVRDLGKMDIEEIKKIFERINATSYSLNAMEIHNARFAGEFKTFVENLTRHPFFDNNGVFSVNEVRRMRDVSFVLVFVITIMSTYFNREDEFITYLSNYNDEFEMKDALANQIERVFSFIDQCDFERNSRAWKNSDLLTLLVEIHRALIKDGLELDPGEVGARIKKFYDMVNLYIKGNTDEIPKVVLNNVMEYSKATSQATNDRGSRIKRGEIIRKVILGI